MNTVWKEIFWHILNGNLAPFTFNTDVLLWTGTSAWTCTVACFHAVIGNSFFYFKYKFIKAIEDTVNTLCVHDRTVVGELWANIYISIIKEKYGQTNKIWTFYELRSHRKRGFKNYIHSGKKKKYQIFIIQLSPCRNTQLLCICGFYFLQGFHVKL